MTHVFLKLALSVFVAASVFLALTVGGHRLYGTPLSSGEYLLIFIVILGWYYVISFSLFAALSQVLEASNLSSPRIVVGSTAIGASVAIGSAAAGNSAFGTLLLTLIGAVAGITGGCLFLSLQQTKRKI